MPTSIQCQRLSHRPPHHGKIAVEILLGLVLTLSVAAGVAYAEIVFGDGQQFSAYALLMQ